MELAFHDAVVKALGGLGAVSGRRLGAFLLRFPVEPSYAGAGHQFATAFREEDRVDP
ncbi:hypothetical protein [Streptomyces sp. NPDC085540]|uniref:hypothetical protein n=1 Tax=Streptomyces sp. NPDC085540 TaxID=3365730 RepID=UPI0037CF49D6